MNIGEIMDTLTLEGPGAKWKPWKNLDPKNLSVPKLHLEIYLITDATAEGKYPHLWIQKPKKYTRQPKYVVAGKNCTYVTPNVKPKYN